MNFSPREHENLPAAREVIQTCLGAGVGAGLLVWCVLFPLAGQATDLFPAAWVDGGGFGLSMSACGVAIVLSAMLMAVRWRFAGADRRTHLTARLAAALAVSVLVSIPLITAFAAHERFSTAPRIVTLEALITAAVLSISITLAVRSGARSVEVTSV